MTEQFAPPICARIRATRIRLRQEALERGDKKAAHDLTQEGMARQLHLSLGGYSAYEKFREPDYLRRQEIAKALGLDADHFESAPADDRDQEIQRLREEVEGTGAKVDRLAKQLDELRRQLSEQAESPARTRRRRAS